jgi:hypothetical protein
LLHLAAAAALGKAWTCPPKFLDLDFPEVGAATMGDDGGDNNNNEDDNANAPTSTSPCLLPLLPGALLPVVVRGMLATLV